MTGIPLMVAGTGSGAGIAMKAGTSNLDLPWHRHQFRDGLPGAVAARGRGDGRPMREFGDAAGILSRRDLGSRQLLCWFLF